MFQVQVACDWFHRGPIHKLRYPEGGVSASVLMYTLSIHQYGIICDEGRGVHNGQK